MDDVVLLVINSWYLLFFIVKKVSDISHFDLFTFLWIVGVGVSEFLLKCWNILFVVQLVNDVTVWLYSITFGE